MLIPKIPAITTYKFYLLFQIRISLDFFLIFDSSLPAGSKIISSGKIKTLPIKLSKSLNQNTILLLLVLVRYHLNRIEGHIINDIDATFVLPFLDEAYRTYISHAHKVLTLIDEHNPNHCKNLCQKLQTSKDRPLFLLDYLSSLLWVHFYHF